MSFFEDASLVLIPSAQKTSKVYSVKPTDGTGDLAFTRSNDTATRVASNGLIEKVRTNLILQSEAFNTTWVSSSLSVTANTTANPLNGALTADTITLTGATIQKYISQPIVFNGSATISVYLKAGTHQFVQLLLGSDAGSFANFDLTNGTASAVGSTATIVSAGSGFFRCSMSFTSTTGTDVIILAANSLADGRFVTTSSTCTLIAFGCQVETTDFGATPYIATTTAAVSVGPVANVPRLDYLNSTCPRLLLEPQRTNLATYSEQFNNAAWTKEGVTITANATTSPDGYTSADKIVANASAGDKTAYQILSTTLAQAFTLTAFYKKSEYKMAFLRAGGQIEQPYVIYNLDTQAVVSTSGATSTTIENYGNGWYRITLTLASASSTTIAPNVSFLPNSGYTLSAANVPAYTGDGTSGGFVWGCQLEANGAAYATSYIPTLGASVTRGGDDCGTTSLQSASLISATAGTFFLQTTKTNDAVWINQRIFLTNTTTRSLLLDTASGQIRLRTWDAASAGATITTSGLANGLVKYLIKWDGTNIKVFANGVLVGSSAQPSYAYTTYSALESTAYSNNTISQLLFFPTALSDADCIALTA